MKVIITSGGTSEKIDQVRTITNMATGTLGSLIAKEFYNKVPGVKIIYICSHNAVLPNITNVNIIKISGTKELKETIETILKTEKIDAVIHSMAVSDYFVSGISSTQNLVEAITQALYNNKNALQSKDTMANTINNEIIKSKNAMETKKKISSSVNNMMLFMEKAPKVISTIKEIQPVTLVGFKLLVDVTKDELLEAGLNILNKNNCDFVLANDLNDITKDKHKAILISPNASYINLNCKQEIAQAIVTSVLNKNKR